MTYPEGGVNEQNFSLTSRGPILTGRMYISRQYLANLHAFFCLSKNKLTVKKYLLNIKKTQLCIPVAIFESSVKGPTSTKFSSFLDDGRSGYGPSNSSDNPSSSYKNIIFYPTKYLHFKCLLYLTWLFLWSKYSPGI